MKSTEVLSALGGAVLERVVDGRFVVRGERPLWLNALARNGGHDDMPFVLGEVFPFLETFLPDAEAAWQGDPGTRVDSDFWTETDPSGKALRLEATAIKVDARCMLVVMDNERLFMEKQSVLQRARELRITHDAFMRELERKDVLVHAIVHDLVAPLHSIMGVFSLLGEQFASGPAEEWIHLGSRAAIRQRELIAEILDVFCAESDALPPPAADGLELDEVLCEVIDERAPVARGRDVRLEYQRRSPSYRVVGERTRLFRILTNLIDNAIRHSPPGTAVSISARCENGSVFVRFDDLGPGVAPHMLPRLFEKFARGDDPASGIGLGLFFCRITLENWGGGIGYETREGGGARFWIHLQEMPLRSAAATSDAGDASTPRRTEKRRDRYGENTAPRR